MPREVLFSASIRLRVGAGFSPDELAEKLTQAGYTRTTLVEGAGQFALRGGILDVFSPGENLPVRCEFFGDELDAMGFFDPTTQRRTENAEEALLLPVAESLPQLHPGGVDGLCRDLESILARQKRRKTPHENLITTLTRDIESLQSGVSFSSADRYMALIYPEFSCAADYLSRSFPRRQSAGGGVWPRPRRVSGVWKIGRRALRFLPLVRRPRRKDARTARRLF